MQSWCVFADNALDLQFKDAQTKVVFQLSAAPPQTTLLVFWRTDCEPCLKDMSLLADFATQHPVLRVLGVSLSKRDATREFWLQHNMPFPTLINDDFPGELLKRFGNPLGAVPYTAMLTPARTLCWSKTGALTPVDLQQALQVCTAKL